MENFSTKSLELALNSLNLAWNEYNKDSANDFVRDSVIQRFEYTYALAVKYIQRYLELNLPVADDVDKLMFNNLIRTANEKGILLGNLSDWAIYRQRRNITSHTYNIEKAKQVLDIIEQFCNEVKYLLGKINEQY